MQTTASPKNNNIKSKISAWVIGFILISILYAVVFEGAASKQSSTEINPEAAAILYADELKRVSSQYRQCMQEADRSPSSIKDPMEGTPMSEENLDHSAREDCSRRYETRMRVLRNKYE